MLTQYETSESTGAKYIIDIPKDVDALKEYMGMIEKKEPEKAETILDKIKKKASTTTRKRKKKS